MSSPFLLAARIEHHLDSFATDNAETLKNDIYADNVITGTDTAEEAKCLYNDAKSMFHDTFMNLRDWVSNKEEINNYIPIDDRGGGKFIKVLSYQWHYFCDSFISITKGFIETD